MSPIIRVIGLSMYDNQEVTEMMIKAGAETFLSKTISSNELIKAICDSEKVSEPEEIPSKEKMKSLEDSTTEN